MQYEDITINVNYHYSLSKPYTYNSPIIVLWNLDASDTFHHSHDAVVLWMPLSTFLIVEQVEEPAEERALVKDARIAELEAQLEIKVSLCILYIQK